MQPCLRHILPKSWVLLCFFFCGKKDSMQKRNIYCLRWESVVWSGSQLGRETWQTFRWWRRGWNGSAQVAETTVKGFYAADFDALVKRWDKCISVGGGYVEKSGSNMAYFTFYIHFWPIYSDPPSYDLGLCNLLHISSLLIVFLRMSLSNIHFTSYVLCLGVGVKKTRIQAIHNANSCRTAQWAHLLRGVSAPHTHRKVCHMAVTLK
jgi:hypothetical protein